MTGSRPLVLTVGMINLKIVRIVRRISQWDLAIRTGIPNYRLSLIETGRKDPTPEELSAIASALGTSVATLNDSEKIPTALGYSAVAE